MSVSIIIPTLNEQQNIKRIHATVIEVFKKTKIKWEIVFVDDKSNDKTQEIIKSILAENISLIESPIRKGLGNAISIGWQNAKLDYVLFLDCDSHVSIQDLKKLINSRKTNSLVIASRYLKKSKVYGAPFIKVFLSKILNQIIGLILSIKISDMSHSLRILPNTYISITEILTHPGYFWVLTKKLKKMNLNIEEIPIVFRERKIGKSKNTTVRMVKSVINTIKIISKI